MVEPPCCGDALRLTIEKFKFFVFCLKFSFPPNGGGGKEREKKRKREKKREKKGG